MYLPHQALVKLIKREEWVMLEFLKNPCKYLVYCISDGFLLKFPARPPRAFLSSSPSNNSSDRKLSPWKSLFFSKRKCEDKQLPRISCFLSSSCKTPPGKLIRICKTGQRSTRKGKEKEALKPRGNQWKVLAFIVPVNSWRSLEKVAQRNPWLCDSLP